MHTPIILAALCLIPLHADAACTKENRKDVDRLLVFPTIAYPSQSGDYNVDLHAVAIDTGSPEGPFGRSIFKTLCGGSDTYFDERWAPFPSTPSVGSPMSVTIGMGESKNVGPVTGYGHVEKTVSVPSPRIGQSLEMAVTVEGLDKTTLTSSVNVRMANPQGWGVISDVDDTIKVSQVLSIPKLLSRTFCQEYVAEAGMPELYAYLHKKLTITVGNLVSEPLFYYLSGSPWQLLSSISKFIANQFPTGEIILDKLNLRCIKSIFHSRDVIAYKLEHIRKTFAKFPERKWLLIGDAGEHDPEIYATIYNEFPERVCHIMIRLVQGTNESAEKKKNADLRFKITFEKVPDTKWDTLTPSKIDEFISKQPRSFQSCA